MDGQNKQDFTWLFGHDSRRADGIESFRIDFLQGSSPDSIRGLLPIEFSQFNASLCNNEGKLLFYSNGCHIVGNNHEILPNGSGINEGNWVNTILDTCDMYPGFQDGLLLKAPSSDNNFYLIHKKIMLTDSFFRILNYTCIDKNLNNQIGDVVEKNQILIDSTQYMSSYLTAIKHSNKNDWWIVQPRMFSSIIDVIKLDESNFQSGSNYSLPFSFSERSAASGMAKFSPDGKAYALYNAEDNLILLDFDRSMGEFSNLKQLELHKLPLQNQKVGSVEWSSNSRFLYLCDQDKLWQVDTWEENLEDGLILIDTWNGVNDPFPNIFFLSALAPDCKIYICSISSANSYHVINNPNLEGTKCDFVQNGVKLPFVSSVATMPNFPRFRVDEEDKCDPTITSVFGDDIYWRRNLTAYPNPMHSELTVELPAGKEGHIYVFAMNGQLVWESAELYSEQKVIIDLSSHQSGTYSVEFIPDKNYERRIWTSKVVKVD